jgi:hypothetical protein
MKVLFRDFGPPKAPVPVIDISGRDDLDLVQDTARALLRKVGL